MKRKKNDRGLTLVEAVMSVLILGIVAGAMAGSFVIGRISIGKGCHYLEAMNIAQAAMEELINDQTSVFAMPDGAVKNLGGTCSSSITGTELKKIQVTITWNEHIMGGTNLVSTQLETYLFVE